MATCSYTNGQYLEHNPTWHVEDSPWKAANIWQLISRHQLPVRTIAEVGCGAGEVLAQLQRRMPDDCELSGYDISPQSHELALCRTNEQLHFHLADLTELEDVRFDLLLMIDLIEHLDDYYGFLRKVQPLAGYKILHIPLDLSAYSVIRSHFLLDQQQQVGHIHFFTKATALAALEHAGLKVIDWFYPTPPARRKRRPLRQHVLHALRRLSYPLHQDLAVRIWGGRSLMVLAQ
jgi:SAM-dependent methyltransferase